MGDEKRGKKETEGGGSQLPVAVGTRALTAAEFQGLGQVPPEAKWFANIDNPETWAHVPDRYS